MQNKLQKINFLLADDHSLIRQGMLFLIEDFDLDAEVFQATNFAQILETLKTQAIHIAILDAQFPEGNTLTILPEIRKIRPEIKILILTGLEESTHALRFINAGANGFLSKLSEEDEMKNALQKMIQDGEYLSTATQSLLLKSLQNRNLINPLSSLSQRELQIAEMYAAGLGNLEIANELEIKQNTVSTMKKRLFEKLEIENIVQLIDLMKEHH